MCVICTIHTTGVNMFSHLLELLYPTTFSTNVANVVIDMSLDINQDVLQYELSQCCPLDKRIISKIHKREWAYSR